MTSTRTLRHAVCIGLVILFILMTSIIYQVTHTYLGVRPFGMNLKYRIFTANVSVLLEKTWFPKLDEEKWEFSEYYKSIRQHINRKHEFPFHKVRNDSIFWTIKDFNKAMSEAVLGDPLHPLSSVRTPCWFGHRAAPKQALRKPLIPPRWNKTYRSWRLRKLVLSRELLTPGPQNSSVFCHPAVYLIGQIKAGSTALWMKLDIHPDIDGGEMKEPIFWINPSSLLWYAGRMFTTVSQTVQQELMDPSDEHAWTRDILALDGLPSLAMQPELSYIDKIPGNRGLSQPKYVRPLRLLALNPKAKFLVILRNPTERSFSHYRYFKGAKKTPQHFHELVLDHIKKLKSVIKQRGLRNTVIKSWRPGEYNGILEAGLYYAFLRDWVDLVPPDQLMILKSEEFFGDTFNVMQRVAEFLNIEKYPVSLKAKFNSKDNINKTPTKNMANNTMLEITKKALDEFYRPFNVMLAKLLNDNTFLFEP